MQVGRINVPCGCKARKDIMFTQGKPGLPEVLMLTTAALAIVAAYRLSK